MCSTWDVLKNYPAVHVHSTVCVFWVLTWSCAAVICGYHFVMRTSCASKLETKIFKWIPLRELRMQLIWYCIVFGVVLIVQAKNYKDRNIWDGARMFVEAFVLQISHSFKQKVAWYDEVLICDYNTCKECYSVWVQKFYLLLRRVVGQKLRKKEKLRYYFKKWSKVGWSCKYRCIWDNGLMLNV